MPVVLLSAPQFPLHITICIDYHCDLEQEIELTEPAWDQLEAIFQSIDTKEDEQKAIQQAIAYMERLAGEQSETWRDLEENQGEGSEIGQLDCISESKNTTAYLKLIEEYGLLKRHRVLERQKRNPWFFDFHWTAVIQDTDSQLSYAVDSWFFKNGEPPIIQPIDLWLSGKSPE